ncbi:unnamed protein product [Prorocentrum cordatum]|uniref:Secreted protein n=1 Tax=Prorocentrum cordatum TaxID=2364126 RepID=A0ABN9V7D5_9DINO|nr:unnamed protein product [Polarella glacialis]
MQFLHHSATSLPFFFSRHCASAALSSSPIAAASWRAVLLHELRGQSGTYPQTAGGSVPALAARRAAVQGRATAVRTAEQELSWPSAFRCFEGVDGFRDCPTSPSLSLRMLGTTR